MANTEKIICPLMTAGWFANHWSSISGPKEDGTFSITNMVPCKKDLCPLWDNHNKSCKLGSSRSSLQS